MVKARNRQGEPLAPLWIRRPEAVVLTGSDWPTVLSVLLAGVGVVLSRWKPWAGLVVTSAASFAVTAVGRGPIPVWMMAVLVLFSFTLWEKQPVAGTALSWRGSSWPGTFWRRP